jgi:hypothetical protein
LHPSFQAGKIPNSGRTEFTSGLVERFGCNHPLIVWSIVGKFAGQSRATGVFRQSTRKQTGNGMKDYVLKSSDGSASGEHVWAFDLNKNKTGEASLTGFVLRNALVTFVTNWCKRLALRFSSLRYLTLS